MKTRIVLFAVLTAGLTACATTPPTEHKATQRIDHAYVNTVDHHASRMGARVYWVNPPHRKDSTEERERR